METPWINKYIPVGCLKIPADASDLSLLEALSSSKSLDWEFFARQHELPAQHRLPIHLQDTLLKQKFLQPFYGLWINRWIQMSFRRISEPDSVGRIRIYILPQDVDRGVMIFKHDLTRATLCLLSQLDYSPDYWNGGTGTTYQGHPVPSHQDLLEGEDTSLLSMFNNVPSPDPRSDLEPNPDTRDGMECLLQSDIPGITTKLFPYQGRSAALMLQREENPKRIVDPRFQSVLDQNGKAWYYDNVSGIVLREPRYYDGVRGGILAEEMGTGKTLICLALIISTKGEPTKVPEPFTAEIAPRVNASLVDMAAAAVNKNSIPWRVFFETYATQHGRDYRNCKEALEKPENRALYKIRDVFIEPRRSNRSIPKTSAPKEVFLSCVTLVVAPNNLVKQWRDEIKKHTTGLKVLVLVEKQDIPPVSELLSYDLILFSESRFELIQKEQNQYCPLEHIRFKRCIIDEGHKLGHKSRGWKSDVLRVLDRLEISARWVVTGTPSRGLYGVEGISESGANGTMQSTLRQEREDLQRIGNIATKYLKVRPWMNTKDEVGDSVADWNVYVMHREQHAKGHNRKDCLRTTLNSLIIRHRLSDISTLLPPVEEKIVVLDGSFQDRLSLNLFSMMIIFNSVQSQRTDMDYFFHERQRKSLIQLVKNLRQACFFGGVFYSVEDIAKSLETAEEFLAKKEVQISNEDEELLKEAIDFGKIAVKNRLKDISNKFHAMPLYMDNFPGGNGKSWSLDDQEADGQPICTDAGMILALQKFLNPCIDAPTSLQLMIESGRLDQQGLAERSQALTSAADASGQSTTQSTQASQLAGNTALGDDHHLKPKSGTLEKATSSPTKRDQENSAGLESHIKIAEPLEKTRIISTVSAKLSYLIDSIVKYQEEEQIIIFYDNDNIAYYLAGVLEILQIQHLIYSRVGLNSERRAQYVATFTYNQKFRVLLMDLTQAAFGLDMRSASRIYFISPVLNPQVEAQAIGRARRISQQKPVSVETLVLRNSIEEVIVNRRKQMTHAEHSKVKSILDDRLIYQWILNAKIQPMSDEQDSVAQTAMLKIPQFVFGRGFGRELHPDEGLITGTPEAKTHTATANKTSPIPFKVTRGRKRPTPEISATDDESRGDDPHAEAQEPPRRRARVAFAE
ncbi:P-loop containing nucleoside triphosphate hydrolase protein [Annulohypoxylon truncatum]|uniref:P-loop containing nucleoside triphosphate hydrolase protein n=1 Tax=Annulohypoxylon truncatum TaxID=327061 RepID=UPI002007FB9D|nr:P-loop containing nucleoside triphosphate hydrolase protein [Annulohypoxylon truncatum]KAI1209441.1 P-loop containing nucleoside triphosphate hydrolase protein [Annulohypoxylon truncatum]